MIKNVNAPKGKNLTDLTYILFNNFHFQDNVEEYIS